MFFFSLRKMKIAFVYLNDYIFKLNIIIKRHNIMENTFRTNIFIIITNFWSGQCRAGELLYL